MVKHSYSYLCALQTEFEDERLEDDFFDSSVESTEGNQEDHSDSSVESIEENPTASHPRFEMSRNDEKIPDPFRSMLQTENLGLILVPTLLNTRNYISWSCAMIRALRAKRKLDYILKEDFEPKEDTPEHICWEEEDSLVSSWICNCISKEFAEGFLYTTSAYALWKNIKQRFGANNGILFFRLKQEVNSIVQGSMSVTSYFTKQRKVWDEMATLRPIPSCSCGVQKFCNEDQLMLFLGGLNNEFEHVKNQILLIDPYPELNTAFSMVLRVEKQTDSENTVEFSTPTVNAVHTRNDSLKKKTALAKADKQCSHCKKGGDVKEECFKIVGYPEWFKSNYKGKKPQAACVAYEIDSPCEVQNDKLTEGSFSGMFDKGFSEMMQREMHKYFSGKGTGATGTDFSTFAKGDCSGPGF